MLILLISLLGGCYSRRALSDVSLSDDRLGLEAIQTQETGPSFLPLEQRLLRRLHRKLWSLVVDQLLYSCQVVCTYKSN